MQKESWSFAVYADKPLGWVADKNNCKEYERDYLSPYHDYPTKEAAIAAMDKEMEDE